MFICDLVIHDIPSLWHRLINSLNMAVEYKYYLLVSPRLYIFRQLHLYISMPYSVQEVFFFRTDSNLIQPITQF